MNRTGADAQDWADKRKAAVERAKQLREERKNGGGEDPSSYTFTPQVNRRPSYLDSRPDTLDQLASQRRSANPDDIMEQPLPGAKGQYDINNFNPAPSVRAVPSPGSDALGKELRKFPANASSNSGFGNQSLGDVLSGKPGVANSRVGASKDANSNSPFRSKFMQQYSNNQTGSDLKFVGQNSYDYDGNDSHSNYKPSNAPPHSRSDTAAYKNADIEAEQIFMGSLRSSEKVKQGSRKQSSGWNDDTTTSGLFGDPRALPSNPRSAERRPPVGSVASRAERIAAHPEPPRRRHQQDRHSGDWNNDTNIDQESLFTSAHSREASKMISPAKISNASYSSYTTGRADAQDQDEYDHTGRLVSPRLRPAPSQEAMPTGARSRLSLLKSKIRRSESSSSSRGDLMRSNGSDVGYDAAAYSSADYNSLQERGAGSAPKTAPVRQDASKPPPRRAQQSSYEEPSSSSSLYEMAAANAVPDGADGYEGEQMECSDCGRKFNPGPYQRHIKICAKVFLQKRKVFDVAKQRYADNPEVLQILKQKGGPDKKPSRQAAAMPKAVFNAAADPSGDYAPGRGGKSRQSSGYSNQPVAAAKKDWKQESDAFRAAMRAARQVSNAIATGAPLPPPTMSAPDPSLVPCPHCGRRFSQKAGERHIPQCQNIIAKPKSLARGTGGAGGVNGSLTSKSKGRGGRF